ncbi:MAG: TIGR02452 family protein [Oscillospiraceae bacterium]|nr:TIGR02452 family protein [Oscillospiraceae bacterium]
MNTNLMENLKQGIKQGQDETIPGFPDNAMPELKGIYALIRPEISMSLPDPRYKAAAILCVLSVAGDLITVNREGYRCNNGFIDSFCQLYRCSDPALENLRVMAEDYIRDGYFVDKACGYFTHNREGAVERIIAYNALLNEPVGRSAADQMIIDYQKKVIRVLSNRLYTMPTPLYMSDAAPRSWDHEAWLTEFLPIWNRRIRVEQHAFRAKYYNQHVAVVQAKCYISRSGKVVQIPWDAYEMMRNSKMYAAPITVQPAEVTYDTQVEVWNMDCLDAAKKIQDETEGVTAVLNLANRQNPGGGVFTGSGAQEESCFLRSNYFTALYPFASYAGQYGLPKAPQQYPLDRNFGGVWSKGVTVFRGKELEGYPLLDEPWKTNFIAVAAINRPATVMNCGELRLTPDMVQGTLNKIRTIMNIAADNNVTNLVLGALGCGAFRNPPRHVAELFRQVLEEPPYKGRFHRIVFAITDGDLCRIFADVFDC